jgi:hypothetical protein
MDEIFQFDENLEIEIPNNTKIGEIRINNISVLEYLDAIWTPAVVNVD